MNPHAQGLFALLGRRGLTAQMFTLIGFGIVMGLAFAAPPGIVTAETFRRGVARGFPAALSVQLGSLIGDMTYCLLALAGVAALVQHPVTQRALGILSVLLLAYLAVSGIRAELAALRRPPANDHSTTASQGAAGQRRGAFFSGMFLSLTNPWAIGFWLSLGGTLAVYGALESGNTMALFFTSFFGASLAYAVLIALLIGVTRRALPSHFGRWLSIGCSVLIGALALTMAWQVMQLFSGGMG